MTQNSPSCPLQLSLAHSPSSSSLSLFKPVPHLTHSLSYPLDLPHQPPYLSSKQYLTSPIPSPVLSLSTISLPINLSSSHLMFLISLFLTPVLTSVSLPTSPFLSLALISLRISLPQTSTVRPSPHLLTSHSSPSLSPNQHHLPYCIFLPLTYSPLLHHLSPNL